ncbi:MAG: type II CAAX prenyl endopeptidase Rce1 family protein [Methylovulum sp.]
MSSYLLRSFVYALIPFAVLVLAASLACVFAYIACQFVGDCALAKVIDKITQALLVLSIFPAMMVLKIKRKALGFAPRTLFLKQLALGFLLGIVTLLPVFAILYGLHISVIDLTQSWTVLWCVQKSGLALLLALLISLIEEPLFRGILLVSFKRSISVFAAISLSAGYYAVLHFLKTTTVIPEAERSFSSGFQLLWMAFGNVLNPEIISALLALVMVGIFLAFIRINYPASLGVCIGCHTGWVWLIKMNKSFFNTDVTADYAFLVSPYDGVIGYLVAGWLAVILLCLVGLRQLVKKRKPLLHLS